MSNTFRGNRHDVREYTRLGSRRTSDLGRVGNGNRVESLQPSAVFTYTSASRKSRGCDFGDCDFIKLRLEPPCSPIVFLKSFQRGVPPRKRHAARDPKKLGG